MELSRQEYWNELPFPPPGDLPDPGIESGSPALQADSFPVWALREALQDLLEVSSKVKDESSGKTHLKAELGEKQSRISYSKVKNNMSFLCLKSLSDFQT